MNESVIIVAGGQGMRMGGSIPKQFLLINGLPVLMHTINRFFKYNPKITVILVLPALQIDYWTDLCNRYDFTMAHTIIEGGETRFHSVYNGLKAVTQEGLIAVHDGVRPFVSVKTITECFNMAGQHGAAIPVTEPVESIRHLSEFESKACRREEYRLVQTPQVFDSQLLKQCYAQPWSPAFTDDASVVESTGHPIKLVTGNRENIKITSPFDLTVAEAIVNSNLLD